MPDMNLDRRTLLVGSAGMAAASFLVPPGPALAAAAVPAEQLPALRRFSAGDAVVTAISDGYIDLGLELFPAADPAAAEQLKQEAFLPAGPLRTAVNAFLVQSPGRTMLVDTGSGMAGGPTMGRLLPHLDAAGVRPEDVDRLLLTHLHPDHVGGAAPSGQPAFPNAQLVVHEADVAFWTDPAMRAQAPAEAHPFFDLAQAALKAYEGRVRTFSADGEVAPNVDSMHLPGHTPGHCGFVLKSGEPMLIWGDIVHAPALQFRNPDWGIAFDVDQGQALATRKRVFDMVSADRLRVAGMHLDFPAVGHVAKEGEAYRYVPARWEYTL